MKRHPFTVEDLWALPRVGTPVPAPDGCSVVVPVTTWSMATNEGTTRLWRVEEGRAPRALTGLGSSSTQPAVSPDGTRVAFVRKPGGPTGDGAGKPGARFPEAPQLWVLPLDGGEPERITDLPLGVADPRWFPDGRRIAFLAGLLSDAPTIEGTAKLHAEREADPVKARVTENRLYRYWDRWLTDGRIHHLFVVDLVTRKMLDLLPGSRRWFDLMDPADQYRIAPDGKEIAFAACRTRPPYDPWIWGVFTVRVPERIEPRARVAAPKCLTHRHRAEAGRPVYSPDGRWILFGMQRELGFYADRRRLSAHDRRTGRQTILTESWDRSAAGWTFSQDGKTIWLIAEDEARTSLFALDFRAALRKPEQHPPRRIARGGTFGAPQIANGRIFATFDTLSAPPEVVCLSRDGGTKRRWTRFCAPRMSRVELGRVREDHFEGAARDRVQMFVVEPARRLRGPAPLVHMIHGGPHGVFGDNWHWRWSAHALAAPGYRVALVNFHGSTSWGQEFAQCIQGRWGDQPFEDILAATDKLIRDGLVDAKRMAAAGGSYGGYMTSWIAARCDRFACVVNHAGVCDPQAEWASDVTQGWMRALGGAPWDDPEGMDRWSPMRHARGFRTPMLVIHGERDFRVPYDQGLAIYNVYRAMQQPARLVCYPDENHWILKPRNSRHWYGEVLGWLARWIGKGARGRKSHGAGTPRGIPAPCRTDPPRA